MKAGFERRTKDKKGYLRRKEHNEQGHRNVKERAGKWSGGDQGRCSLHTAQPPEVAFIVLCGV